MNGSVSQSSSTQRVSAQQLKYTMYTYVSRRSTNPATDRAATRHLQIIFVDLVSRHAGVRRPAALKKISGNQ
jgi:hypothetical protein